MNKLMYSFRKSVANVKFLRGLLWPFYRVVRDKKEEKRNARRMAVFNDLQDRKRIFLLGIPETNNLGDLAQQACAHEWFRKNYPDYQVVEFSGVTILNPKTDFLATLQRHIKNDDYIFFESGGNMHDFPGVPLAPTCPLALHQLIVKNISNVPIVFLPETIKFWDQEKAKQVAAVFNANPNVFLITRDPVSYDTSRDLFPAAHKTCYPDIVTTLIGATDHSGVDRDGIVMCLRNDRERDQSNDSLKEVAKRLKGIGTVKITDTCLPVDYSSIEGEERAVVEDFIKMLAHAKVVITDRYHGTIFSLIAGTPVVVLRSLDHKVVTGQAWLKKSYSEYVEFAATHDELVELTRKMYEGSFSHSLGRFPDAEKFDSLKDEIEGWRASLAL